SNPLDARPIYLSVRERGEFGQGGVERRIRRHVSLYRRAISTAWVLFSACNLPRMFEMWLFTVPSLRTRRGDVLVGSSLSQQDQYFTFALRERLQPCLLRAKQLPERARRDLRLDKGLASMNAPDGAHEFFGRGVLEQVAKRAGADRPED